MALIKSIKGKKPHFGKDYWLADNATIVGDVTTGDNCTIWFNAVIRGDVNSITIGHKVNIQDNAVIHCTYQKAATYIGNNVSIGHNANVHGCTRRSAKLCLSSVLHHQLSLCRKANVVVCFGHRLVLFFCI